MALDLLDLLMADVRLAPTEGKCRHQMRVAHPLGEGEPQPRHRTSTPCWRIHTAPACSPSDELQGPGVELVKVI